MIRKLLPAIATVILSAYLVVALSMTYRSSGSQLCAGMQIVVRDSVAHGFVTAGELGRELGDLPALIRSRRIRDINTDSIEQVLAGIDKIERSCVTILTDGRVLITVDPMEPVARIFEPSGKSYYINREGKRISASARYHIDVPVILGSFSNDSIFSPTMVIPLLDWLEAHPQWNNLVSAIKVDSPRDILIVPIVRGHVINLGAPEDLDSKFSRLSAMYRKVLPVRGWETYDTLTLKWGGQVVATRRDKQLAPPPKIEEFEEEVDLNTMIADSATSVVAQLPRKESSVAKKN